MSETAERKVKVALQIIDEMERRLKRGVLDEEFDLESLRQEYAEEPQTKVDELEDLWRVLEELLASGRLDEALRVANAARARFSEAPEAHAAFGWLAAVSSRSNPETTKQLRKEGLRSMGLALERGVKTADSYAWTAILQLDLHEYAGAKTTLDDAQRVLGNLTPWHHSHRCEAHAGLGDTAGAARDGLASVNLAPDDSALRSNTAGALVKAARTALLPIADATALHTYIDVINLAAWCADGVPEAEDYVRPYRLWAAQAASSAYVGRIEWRSIISVLSGFLLLPVMNRARSKPVWKLFFDGPQQYGEMGQIVVDSPIAQFVHEGLQEKLKWSR